MKTCQNLNFLHWFGLNMPVRGDINEHAQMWTEQPVHGYYLYIGIKVSPIEGGCSQK